jgi:hypothetical protein
LSLVDTLPLVAPLMPGVAAALPVAGEVALPPVAPVSELPAPVPELAFVVLSPVPYDPVVLPVRSLQADSANSAATQGSARYLFSGFITAPQ